MRPTHATLLRDLLTSSLLPPEEWAALPAEDRSALEGASDSDTLLSGLVDRRLLTVYQAARIRSGKRFGLFLGNYRVLDRIGAGGMGIVLKAEHVCLRRLVAIKVLSLPQHEDNDYLLSRFYSEMRTVAQLQHPNIVAALDAGKAVSDDPDAPVQHYFVMAYEEGKDLEEHVLSEGPFSVGRACEVIYQLASALDEAHKHHLVHRDIKPSNVLLTASGQAKLLDFGLARHFRNRMTEPGTVLGTVEYIAPEQARDSSSVDIRADLYSLGGTLFWCLCGRTPFPQRGNFTEELLERLTQPPPSARLSRPDLPPELDALIARLMALRPEDRYPNPQAVMRALLPYLHAALPSTVSPAMATEATVPGQRVHRVLIVDDEADIGSLCQMILTGADLECDVVSNGPEALERLGRQPYDLVLLDIDMPEMSGLEVMEHLRNRPPCSNLKIIMFSGRVSGDEMAQMLLSGVDDFVSKPFSTVQLMSRVRAALKLRDAQERSALLTGHLLSVNAQLEHNLTARDSDLVHARNALVLSLAGLVELRHTETGSHLMRMQRYCRVLGDEAAREPALAERPDENFLRMLECCSPLHDIGKVALPDHILLKPGKLTADERILMQTHTVVGAETLQKVAHEHGNALAFLQMGIDICRSHHERFDGAGYPDRLAGNDIPLPARMVALTDVYDALRSRRVYKPALSHTATMQIMLEGSEGQFDPVLLPVFQRCARQFDGVFKELAD